MSETETCRSQSILTLEALSDRELQMASFLLLSALAERVVGLVPCVKLPPDADLPTLIHGADGQVAWLIPPEVALASPPEPAAADVKYRHAIEDVATRLMDLADIMEKKPSYDPVGFLRAAEKRCRRLLAGGDYNDTLEELTNEKASR